MEEAIIKARVLKKKFGKLVAVDGINFDIRKGECFGFLGPNGAGKTSTVRMIYCASPKSSGSLTVLGLDTDISPAKIKMDIGVVQQENNLDPDFTAFENLIVYSRYFGISREIAEERAERLLKFLHLTKKRDTEIEELSGGMNRRLMIARALLNEPKILVLDEPTTGLDPQARHLIWNRLRSLREEGITVILTTHYMDEAAHLCDRLVIMDGGKILVKGTPQTLVENFGGGREMLEIGADDIVKKNIEIYLKTQYSGGKTDVERVGDMLFIYSDDCHRVESELASRFRLREKTIRMTNLEDVFLKLTGRGLRE